MLPCYRASMTQLHSDMMTRCHNACVKTIYVSTTGARWQRALPTDVKEVAILTAAAQYGETFVSYSHEAIAIHTGKISTGQSQSLRRGEKPDGLTDECNIAYDVAKSLCGNRGPLSGELWDRAVKLLGKETTTALLHYIGFYSYVSIALNGIDAPIPQS